MFIIDPPATAGGTDLLQVQLLIFEARPDFIGERSRLAVATFRLRDFKIPLSNRSRFLSNEETLLPESLALGSPHRL